MKTMLTLFCLIALIMAACNNQPAQYYPPAQPVGAYHEIRVDPNTGQQVVYVQQADGTNYFLDLVLFNSLFNSGGYGSVYGYYGTHTTYIRSYSTHYTSYRPSSRYYGKSQDRTFRPSAPSARNTVPSRASAPSYKPSSSSSTRSSAPSYRPSSPSRSSAPSYHSSSSSSRRR